MRIAYFVERVKCGFLVAACIALVGSSTAVGDTIFHDNIDGGVLQFTDICESTSENVALFGQPEMLEEMLFANSNGFSSNSVNSFEFLQGALSMTITAAEGTSINSIDFSDFGSYFVFGEDAMISSGSQGFVESNGEFYFGESEFTNNGGNGVWESNFEITFPETESITLTVNSQIFSTSGDGEAAFVDKAGSIINVGFTTSVPEPSAGILLVIAVGLVTCKRRRL